MNRETFTSRLPVAYLEWETMPNQQPRQNSPVKRSSTHAQSQAGKGGRKAPRASQSKRTIRSNGKHGKAVSKSKSVTKSRPSSTTPQFSTTRVQQALAVIEGQYNSAQGRQILDLIIARPRHEDVENIVAHDWQAIESVVGCVAKHERSSLVWAAIRLKQHEQREARAKARDNARKRVRSEKPEPIRRRGRQKSKV